MSLKVLKFGGSSVGSAPALLRAAEICAAEIPEGGLVVVSALQGTTDQILEAIEAAAKGEATEAKGHLESIKGRHQRVAYGLGLLGALEPTWEPLFQRLGSLLSGMGMLWEATPRARDAALAVGETLSARIFTALLHREGLAADFQDAREILHTDARHGAARPRLQSIRTASGAWRATLEKGGRIVTQGFIGSGPDGATTTLGRGGSDTTATLLGEAFGADEVQIWTDVDGVLTADPSLVLDARPIPFMSLAEASVLSAFGAKVLHADSLAPVARSGLRLIVANTLRPDASFTEILSAPPERRPGEVTSVAYKEGLSVLRFPPDKDLEAVSSAAKALQDAGALRYGFVSTPEGSLLAVRTETSAARALALQFRDEGALLELDQAVVALVGEGLRSDPGAVLRLLAPVQGGAFGGLLASGPTSLAFLVPQSRLRDLIPALHASCIDPISIPQTA